MKNLIKIGQIYSSLKALADDEHGRRRTDGGPFVFYKLTLRVLGSGELRIKSRRLEKLTG